MTKSLSRRSFAAGLVAAPLILKGKVAPNEARVKIDLDRTIGEIDPNIFGNFAEMLGRCIEGGIYQPGSPLSDSEGFRKDVMQAVKGLQVPLLRWPGGNFSSNYDWRDGIGPQKQRPPRLDLAWGTVDDNQFGTHEFLRYCDLIRTQPYLCVNLGTGTWDEAQQWVEYCNSGLDTAATRMRARNGRAEPWKVTYWGLGNEMDGSWQMGHRDAEGYSRFALEAAKMMKWTDKSIKLVAAGSSNFGADWMGWNRTVLQTLKHHADYLSLHMYVGNRANDYYDFMARPLELAQRTKIVEGLIRESLADVPDRKIYIAWDEWNVWYRARDKTIGTGRHLLEEQYNLEDALMIAMFLNTFINNAHIVKMANLAQLVNVIAPIFTNDTGLFLQTIYHPLKLMATTSRGTALDLFVESSGYENKQFGNVPYLDISAALDGGELVLNMVNRHQSEALTVDIELEDATFGGSFQAWRVNGPDIKSTNSFGSSPVGVEKSSVNGGGSRIRYQLPAHSFTVLKGTAG